MEDLGFPGAIVSSWHDVWLCCSGAGPSPPGPLSMGFPREDYWSELFLSQGIQTNQTYISFKSAVIIHTIPRRQGFDPDPGESPQVSGQLDW